MPCFLHNTRPSIYAAEITHFTVTPAWSGDHTNAQDPPSHLERLATTLSRGTQKLWFPGHTVLVCGPITYR